MKNLKYVLIMFVALTATIACSDDGDDGDVNPIVGTWGISESEGGFAVSISATFNENNKGTMVATITIGDQSETDNSSFTWSTSGDQLTMTIDGDTEVSTYSISGDKLTIIDEDDTVTVLTRE
jgi:hypothetical protein